MPSKLSKIEKPSTFASEADEADWLTSRKGRRYADQQPRNTGVIIAKTRKVDPKLRADAKRTGKAILYKNGLDVKPTAPAVLKDLMPRASRKTQVVSLRIPVCDVEAAKRLGAQTGLGYQTVMKEIISKALRHA